MVGVNALTSSLRRSVRSISCHRQDEWVSKFTALDDSFRARGQPSGSTCVVAVIREHALEIGNLGDSRAILFRAGAAVARTHDHKPSAAAERERIERCGGIVEVPAEGPARVGGVAVSRAFGTFVGPMGRKMLKEPSVPHAERLVSCIPDLFSWPTEKGDILVLACDGVWDVLSEEEVATLVSGQLAQEALLWDVSQSARAICEKALQTSTDNVSCIVAELGGVQPPPQPQATLDVVAEHSCQVGDRPGFNRASREQQLEVGHISGYGETLIDMMVGLETDLMIEQLWLGQVGDACFEPFLSYAKISRIVNCAAEIERPTMEGIEVFSLKWRDSEDQGKAEAKGGFRRLRQATRFIHDSIETGEVALVHCVQGISRSASVIVAYLMEYRQMSMEEAVSLVRQRHPVALRPFPLQEMLRSFHYSLQT